ncbi:hypothetical protein POM88_028791 [Heracleum sosnowskyi]|uniref:Uncharacterized protein n=1 Tax=Heracleum sosnowskyi TaxID=360622 RepID=A0AAD8HUK5_9APIA|nr:hypothetical protein POM88_028791 [Heracleum sosnowskyi]
MAIVTYAYKGMYETNAEFYIDEMRDFLSQIFKEYSEKFGKNSGLVENSRSGSGGIVGSSVGREWLGGFQDFVASSNLAEQTRKNWLRDLKDGKSEKVVEDGSSMMCDLSYNDWDLDF